MIVMTCVQRVLSWGMALKQAVVVLSAEACAEPENRHVGEVAPNAENG